jgi:hypothetical protein
LTKRKRRADEQKADTPSQQLIVVHEAAEEVETLDMVIAELRERFTQLGKMIDRLASAEEPKDGLLVKVFAQHAQSASRLGRLLRDRRALSGEAADGFVGALGLALDELAGLWGRDDL